MKTYFTDSDGGTVLFGNETFSFKLSNNYGDCTNTIHVFDSEKEFLEHCTERYGTERRNRAFKWIMPVSGKFNIYNYDCLLRLSDEDIAASFEGTYSVYLRSSDYEAPIFALVPRQ